MMFGLFKKKSGSVITDKIWMTEDAKCRGLLQISQADQNIVIICWFQATLEKLNATFPFNGTDSFVYMAGSVHGSMLRNKQLIFAEHHPLIEKEKSFLESHGITKATVHTSLDEPLLIHFGGERMAHLMRTLGMNENDPLENALISRSIRNAQESLAKKSVMELSAHSQGEWLKKNLPG
ncbi:MAG: hypothetical protein IPP73_17060 [Chitinophagaceae bacterium]|nr:hypothetical protein [Chitinophagaceae bacterium]